MPTGTLVTVAPTGAEHTKADVPALPVTLDELVTTARQCEAADAAMIHVHVRDDDARPTLDLARLTDTVAALRQETDLVVQLSTGGAVTDPQAARLRVLDALPDSASCTMGTVNFGDDVFLNPWPFIVALHRGMVERGIVGEYEIFDLGQLTTLRRLLDEYGPPAGGHVHVDLVMGVPGGMPGDTATLVAAVAAVPEGATFSATGVGRTHLPVALASLSAGGHLRVGMEDTLTLARGQRVTANAQLVARAADLARLAQRPPLTPEQARHLLGVSRVHSLAAEPGTRQDDTVIEVRPGGRRRIDRVLAAGFADDLDRLPLGDVRARRDEAAQEETDLSYMRRRLHGRIDIVLAEQRRRSVGGEAPVISELARILSSGAVGPTTGSVRHQIVEPSHAESHRRHVEALVSDVDLSDVASLSADELAAALAAYRAEEESVSQRRHEVQQVMDRCNAEIGSRYARGTASVDDLLADEAR